MLRIRQLTFSGPGFHKIDKDTHGDFPSPEWVDGRAQADQSPVSYARNSVIGLSAAFIVTTVACRAGETVQVRGTATFGPASLEWTGAVTVNPGDTTVTATFTSNQPLPNVVGIFESTDITWHTNRCNEGWTAAGTTRNVIYVTLGRAAGGVTNYWTLLDVSCRAAAGRGTEDDLVRYSYAPFIAARGDRNGIRRKRDGQELSYWKLGRRTPPVFDTAALLGSTANTGRCGSWARFLVDMHKVHGITSSSRFSVKPTAAVGAVLADCEFMVQSGSFNGGGSETAPFTHVAPGEYVKNNGLPGIGKSNPQAVFPDHSLVSYGGKIYDPSYGGAPVTSLLIWERAAISGLCAGGTLEITQDGHQLRMRERCSKGFTIYTARAGDTLASIASSHGVGSAAALYSHPYNAAFRAGHPPPGSIAVGDAILIPREISNVAILEVR